MIFLNEAEYFIKQVATMRAIEAMYCYEYYSARGSPVVELGKQIPERLCKDDSIQKQLARTAGLIMFIRMLSALIGAVPLGWLADRSGRKVVLVMHKINVTMSCAAWLVLYLCFPKVPIWTLYLSGLPGIIGGNFDIGISMLFASYTDVMPSSTERASLFFITTSMQYLAQAFCPSIGAWLMNMDGKGGTPQVNMAVSLAVSTFVMLLTIFAFPETVQESRSDKTFVEDDDESEPPVDVLNRKPHLLKRKWEDFSRGVSGVGAANVLLLALSILFGAIGIKSIDWYALVQYPVVKLHWTFPQASNVVSMQGILMLLHFSIILPTLNRVAASYLGSPGRAHFAIMAGSSVLLTAGAALMGLSATSLAFVLSVVLYLFGEGLPTATQAYIVSLIDKSKVARVMATLSMASIGGKLIASILFPKMLAIGIDTHIDVLIGLPFFVSAGLFVVSAICVTIVGIRTKHPSKAHAGSDEA